ncbi:helix-turn-helix domain-containing protein [Rothia sp. P5764]|uniref:helix-turn-helix domain-containing protein n=1 Tax=Rothia sp. P5764 TaxID=3402654 RepID=UPI003AC0F0D6
MNVLTLTPNQVIANEIRAWMARTGLKQVDLAEALQISQGSTSEKLRGKIAFSLNDLLIISGVLGITLGELLGEGIINAKIPPVSIAAGDKKNAPFGFKPNGASYQVVPPLGLEPRTQGF